MESIIPFWFPNNIFNKFWFDRSLDNFIRNNYKQILNDSKLPTDLSLLSNIEILQYIILFDQFSRNIFRNNKEMISKYDILALKLTEYFFENRNFKIVKLNHLIFYLMPYRHTFNIQHYHKIFEILDIYKKNNKVDVTLYNKFYKVTTNIFNKLK